MWTLCCGCSEADHILLPRILQGINVGLSHCWLSSGKSANACKTWPISYSSIYI